MKYIKEDKISIELITKFLEENKFAVTKINFGDEGTYVNAHQEDDLLNEIYGAMMQSKFRSVGLFASMMSLQEEYNINDILFKVNDFEFSSVFDGKSQVVFTGEWREYMAKNLPEEQKKSYSKDLEDYVSHNIWENI